MDLLEAIELLEIRIDMAEGLKHGNITMSINQT